MATTGFKFDNVDLVDIFSSNTGNNTYSNYYTSLSKFDVNTSNTTVIKGSDSIGYKINNTTELVTIFSPIYYDIYETKTIDVPKWANKIGFIIQAAGGNGGIAYTDYWKITEIPINYQIKDYTTASYNYFTHVPYFFRSYYGVWNSGNHDTQQHVQVATYTTTYTRDTQNRTNDYKGSGGGGGSCTAGVYNINKSVIPLTMSITYNLNNSYSSIQFNDTNNTVVSANNGKDVTPNPLSASGTVDNPKYYKKSENLTNTSSDKIGDGGPMGVKNDPMSRITHYYSVAGSNGGAGSIITAGTAGTSGFNNDTLNNQSFIHNLFVPNILPINGSGGLGSGTSTANNGTNGIIRYWFIR